jgi:putative transcriptional regulator
MRIMQYENMSDAAILGEIGRRLRRERLNRNLTQAELAKRIGVGRRTLQNSEDGEVTTLATLVAILRGLDLLGQLDKFIPDPPLSPIQLAKLQGRRRQRASREGSRKTGTAQWKWND